MMRRLSRVLIALFLMGSALAAHAASLLKLQLASGSIEVEVAATKAERALGLMHRKVMPEWRGMLFVYPSPAYFCMWMKNTRIPLSVAFIDAEGKVINIEDMAPHTETNHCTARNAMYALEANHGWFAKNGVLPGTQVLGLEQAPPGAY